MIKFINKRILKVYKMKILYEKRIDDANKLAPFVTPLDYENRVDEYIVRMKYDIIKLESVLTDELEGAFKQNGFDASRTASNILWVSNPEKLSLRLQARVSGRNSRTSTETDIADLVHFDERCRLEEKGTRKKVGGGIFSGSKRVPVYWERPSVIVSGEAAYEIIGSDPAAVLKILKGQGYDSDVITTPEEGFEAMVNAGMRDSKSEKRIAMRRKRYSLGSKD